MFQLRAMLGLSVIPPMASLRMRWRTSSTKSINSSLAMIWQHLPFRAGRPVGQATLTQVASGGEVFFGRLITRTRAVLSVFRLQPLISSTASIHCATIILPDEEKSSSNDRFLAY